MAGYSSGGLAAKLGLGEGMVLYAIDPPEDYAGPLGIGAAIGTRPIRARALKIYLVDVKVCAVSDIWSGLKLVVRRHLR